MNPLLLRQLRKHLPSLDPQSEPWREFLTAVSGTYEAFNEDQRHLEHVLAVTSDELSEANERLRRDSERRIAALNRQYLQTLEYQQGMILCVRQTPLGFQHTLSRGQLLRRFGRTPEQVEGRFVDELAPEPQASLLNAGYSRAWAGEETTLSLTASDGTELFMVLRPRREDGVVCEVIASCVEIGSLKAIEHELRAAKDRAESADRAKSEFLAVMSHEIRTPLNAILGFAQMLGMSNLDADQRSWLATLTASSEALHDLINDILDYSKIEAGRLDLHYDTVAPVEFIESIAAMFRPRVEAKGLKLTVAARYLPATIRTDGTRLRQVLVNLVGNALKFTAHGGIELRARVVEDHDNGPEPSCVLRFEVADTGVGIPPEGRERLFKAFSQVDSSLTRSFGGTGLGLAISRRLVTALGGEIDFDSAVGRGTTFFFTIRASLGNVREVEPAPVRPEVTGRASFPHLRVLVVEDQPTNRALMNKLLAHYGCAADFAENGRIAVNLTAERDYDLILMDLLMPELDGFGASQEIRARTPQAPPRILALTASSMPDLHERCRAAGMDGVLTKPVRFKELETELAATPAAAATK